MTYTEDDFKQVRFAHHPKYGVAMRAKCIGRFQWKLDGGAKAYDVDLAKDGWIPVREAKPITESELEAAYRRAAWPVPLPGEGFNRRFARELGIEIVPDPEPTEAERLDLICENWKSGDGMPGETLGEWLVRAGVRLEADDEG